MRQLYQFKEEDAFNFAQSRHAELKRSGKELQFKYCPICNGGSGSKRDKYTFAINMETGACNCLRSSCRYTGNMITLARDFGFSLGREIDEYYQPRKQYKRLPTPKAPIVPKDPAIKYLESRKISPEIAKQYEVTTHKDHDNWLVFMFYDGDEKLQAIKYRKTDFDKTKDAAKEWFMKGCKPILFGMKQCNMKNKTLIVCEGQLDSLAVATAGFENAVSVPNGARGFTWIPYCHDWMMNFEEIIVFGDYEKGHITLLDDIRKRFPQKVRYVRPEDYKDCKDANELLMKYGKQAIVDAINNAVIMPIKRVVVTRDVQMADYSQMKKLRTNIDRLDVCLGGGLPFGAVCLITGKRGDGKSVFATNIMTGAIDQGFSTLIYSGEMRKDHVKRSLVLQAAGRKHIATNETHFGMQRVVTPHNMELIDRWFGEKSYLYDSDCVDNEHEDLLNTIEDAIQQYGVEVILLDNLMTAMYLNDDRSYDKYDRQGKFVRRLAEIAVLYDVLIILVAHRRKSAIVTDANDEVSGSSDITNLAGVVISYDRPNNKEIEDGTLDEDQRKIILSKNRFFGTLEYKGIVVDYDPVSTRVFDASEENNGMLTHEYGWTGNENNGFMGLDDDSDNPFMT